MELDHSRAPLVEALQAYREVGVVPYTTPGHKRGSGIEPSAALALGRDAFINDIPVASGVDDTHTTLGLLGAAEHLAADAFGAARSYFLLNGSSIGNQVALLSVAGPGDEILVARNVHKSIMTALILCGAKPVYLRPCYDAEAEVAHGLDPAEVAANLDAHPAARAVVVVSPSYFGVASDLPALANVCHAHGVPLIVDEAWAPHFTFHPDLPPSAMQAGADIGVASIHKVLTGFTQSSILNVRGILVESARIGRWLDLLQTTSPSAFILASIDACRRQMALHGTELLERTLALSGMARRRIDEIGGLRVMGREVLDRPGTAAIDETKLVIDVRAAGLSGYEADEWLRAQCRVTVEMSDHRRIVALLSIADTVESAAYLVNALSRLVVERGRPARSGSRYEFDPACLDTESVLTPAEAFRASGRFVPLKRALGEVSAGVVTPYPPGIPLLAPGERVTRPIVDYLLAGLETGMHVTGMQPGGNGDTEHAAIRVI